MSEQTPLLTDQPPGQGAPPPVYSATPSAPPYQTGQPQPPPPAGGTVLVTAQPQVYVTPQARFSDVPTQMTCPSCHQNVLTRLDYSSGVLTWILVLVLFLVGFAVPCVWFGCCLIPLCVQGVKDVNHVCPNCGQVIGSYKRI